MKIPLRALAALTLAAPLLAQDREELPPPRAEAFDASLAEWRADHGANWRARTDPATGHLELLYGGNAPAPVQPDTNVEADWFALARHWVDATLGMHGIESFELADERFTYLPLGMANGTDKITVRLSQEIGGVPVENGKVNALFDTQGRLLSLHSTGAPLTEALSPVPTIGDRTAVRAAVEAFTREAGVPALEVGAAALVFAQVEVDEVREARLAWQVSVHNSAEPAGYRYTVDARTGDVVRRDQEIHDFDVFGTIRSMATPGTEADHAGNPPAQTAMSYVNVTSSAGTIQTDADGNFNFVGVNTPLNITVEYNGTFNNVNNQAGSDYSITFNNVQAGIQNDLLMNPSPTQQVTAQANAYQHVNVLRDYVRGVNPGDNKADFKATSNPNISSTCNAYFNGNSVNYYLAGGGCNNTAFSSVIVHEMGHWLNVNYATGNGSDGMGEGNADVFGMYVYDDPIVGRYFFTGGGFVRTGQNTRQFCGDCCGGCYGEVHADGEVWMGAAWKVRRNLKTTLGNAAGGATADQLFMGWMNAYNQTQIKSIIETQWLTLDDDDGDIGNGTPNYSDIDSGFTEQGFPGVQLDFFDWQNVTVLPDVPADVGPYTVNADVTAALNPPVAGVDLHWVVNGGPTNTVPMANMGGNTYSGDIPALGGLGFVEYWLTATDGIGNSEDFPKDGSHIEFTVGTEQTLISWDFEAAGDQGWVGHLPSDTATTGEWERGDPVPTAAQPGDDHTPGAGNVNCWFTGQQPAGGSLGTNDVDNGRTTLRSPVIDMTALSGVKVRYWRWYSNDEGGAPNADIFRVQVSNNGGANWSDAEIVGPGGTEASGGWFEGGFLLDNIVTPTANVMVQFIAEDAGSGSIVEAAVDDVEIVFLETGCKPPTNYCVGAPNSFGSGAVMAAAGSQDVGDNNLTLIATACPPGQFGLFFYGDGQAMNPVGDGFMCLGGSLFRLPVVKTDVIGQALFPLDFNNLPAGGAIQNGDTWNFQFWFRDPPFGAFGYNFSDGLEIEFCD